VSEQLLAGIGERHASRRAIEKPDAELLFEAADGLT
jgi:hypothetical protein